MHFSICKQASRPTNWHLGLQLSTFLAGLPRLKRNIFIERYFYLSSITEIAKAQGMKESAVKMQLMRMRAALRRDLEEQEIEI